MIGGALGLGSESTIVLDGWFGAAIHPHLALFGEVMGFATAEAGLGFLGGGVRLSYARVFLNARLGRASQSYSCDFDDPCTSAAAVAGVIGIGLEPLHSTHAGLEIRLDVFRAFQDTLIAVGVGGSFYLL